VITSQVKKSLIVVVAAIGMCGSFSSCSTSGRVATVDKSAVSSASKPSTTAESSMSDLERIYWERINAGRSKFVQADVNFMTGMILHHSQALIMSRMVPEQTNNHTLHTLAARIINAQVDEIGTMQKWLRDRKQNVPIVSFDGINLVLSVEKSSEISNLPATNIPAMGRERSMVNPEHGGHVDLPINHEKMPGMLMLAQLQELKTLRDTAFDIKFLEYMIQHHTGAIFMVNELMASDGATNDEESYRLAVDIYAEQVTEIDMMKLMLEELSSNRSKPE
jgi:uncharacterized protein (DUF305 family)